MSNGSRKPSKLLSVSASVAAAVYVAAACVAQQAEPALAASTATQPTTSSPVPQAPATDATQGVNAPRQFDALFRQNLFRYTQPTLPAMSFTDSPADPERAQLLVQGGTIRLTLADAIALTVENNLDVESVRLLSPGARADLQRARSGQLLRNLELATNNGPASAGGVLPAGNAFGYEGLNSGQGSVVRGLAVQLIGSPIPNTEPVFFANTTVRHQALPQSNSTVTGTNFLNQHITDVQAGVRKGFFTGTTVTGAYETLRLSQNAPNNTINPSLQQNAFLRVDQHLLQGFGRQTNLRAVHIAVNDQRIGDLSFRQQLTVTISQVIGLYYDLQQFQAERAVLLGALDRSRTRLEQIRKLLEYGTVGQSTVISAELNVHALEQQTVDAEAQIEAQEATLKSVLTHAGLENASIVGAHIEPLDSFDPTTVPDVAEEPAAVADRAIRQRSEVQAADLAMTNKHLGLLGTRNALRPTFDLYVQIQGNALAGQLNRFATASAAGNVNPVFLGGAGTALQQILHGTYPDYTAGFQLNIPLINRAAQSDMARDQLDLRQQEISRQALRNGIRLQAIKSALALKQAREQYKLAVQTRTLLTQSLDTETKLLDFGTSTPDRVNDIQLQLDQAQIRQITALNTLARARINLQAVLNETLDAQHVVLQTAAQPR